MVFGAAGVWLAPRWVRGGRGLPAGQPAARHLWTGGRLRLGAALLALAPGAALAEQPSAALGPYFEGWRLYLGGHLAYGRGTAGNRLEAPGLAAPAESGNRFGSLYGGLQIGLDRVFPSGLLLGIEADLSVPDYLEDGVVAIRGAPQSLVTHKLDMTGTLRGRLGYAFDRWLLYATGGLAWSRLRTLEAPGLTGAEDEAQSVRFGWAAGFGAELAFAPRWTARLEYLYDSFDAAAVTLPSGTRSRTTLDLHALRVGLNYQLGGTAGSREAGEAWPIRGENWNLHGQFTAIGQGYPAFRSPYRGPQSLAGHEQFKSTFSATAFLGFRPWEGTEIYLNPELMQGFGLSDTFGVAAFPNGEAQKSNFPMPRANIARLFVRQTFGFGGEQEEIADGPNQLAGRQDIARITVTAGKMVVRDFFDVNAYAGEPRTGFLNWNLYGGGSYDLTMDKLSYTWGAFVELNQRRWAVRAGWFAVPTVSNFNTYDAHVPARGESIAELELRYELFEQPGKLRLMGWANRAVAGSYAAAVAQPRDTPGYPDITLTRRVRTGWGVVLNLEQAITDQLGMFSRLTWNAGQTEKIGWTDADMTVSLGAVLHGASWGRPHDAVALGGVVEWLSPEARRFFAAGGRGILIGDGRLTYRSEAAIESYYALALDRATTVTFDYQLLVNPAYNADRGPVSIFAGRLHLEF